MKVFEKIIIFMLLLFIINSTCISGWNKPEDQTTDEDFEDYYTDFDFFVNDTSASLFSCVSRSLNSYEKSIYKVYKCCYFSVKYIDEDNKKKSASFCYGLTTETYDNSVDFANEMKTLKNFTFFDINCIYESFASYLKISFIYLILTLL